MIVTFLQYFKTNQYSLGSLLLKFFYCFGWDFDYKFQQIIPLDENLKEPETINVNFKNNGILFNYFSQFNLTLKDFILKN